MLLQDLVVRIQTRQSISTRSPTLALADRPALRRTVAGVVPVNGSGARRGRVVGRERLLRRVTSRRLPLLWVLFTEMVGLAIVNPFAVAHGGPTLEPRMILTAMAGSLAGLVGIAGLYRAITLGVASIAAPISATGAILSVAFRLTEAIR